MDSSSVSSYVSAVDRRPGGGSPRLRDGSRWALTPTAGHCSSSRRMVTQFARHGHLQSAIDRVRSGGLRRWRDVLPPLGNRKDSVRGEGCGGCSATMRHERACGCGRSRECVSRWLATSESPASARAQDRIEYRSESWPRVFRRAGTRRVADLEARRFVPTSLWRRVHQRSRRRERCRSRGGAIRDLVRPRRQRWLRSESLQAGMAGAEETWGRIRFLRRQARRVGGELIKKGCSTSGTRARPCPAMNAQYRRARRPEVTPWLQGLTAIMVRRSGAGSDLGVWSRLGFAVTGSELDGHRSANGQQGGCRPYSLRRHRSSAS